MIFDRVKENAFETPVSTFLPKLGFHPLSVCGVWSFTPRTAIITTSRYTLASVVPCIHFFDRAIAKGDCDLMLYVQTFNFVVDLDLDVNGIAFRDVDHFYSCPFPILPSGSSAIAAMAAVQVSCSNDKMLFP